MPSEFVFYISDGYVSITRKEVWNANGGYVDDRHTESERGAEFLRTLSPDFSLSSESTFTYKGKATRKNAAEARKLLMTAGVIEGVLGQTV